MNSVSINPGSVQDDSCDWFPPAWSLASGPKGPFRVLVCEPRAGLRRQTGAAFRQAALETTFAADVEEALTLVRGGGFNVAVVDPEMNDSAGLKLCSTLTRARQGSMVPVVTWCESRSVLLAVRSRIAGASVHLMRPVSLDRFVNAVWDVAAHHASREGLIAAPH
jgi:DNA-binding NtrC family response regulator